MHRAVVVVMMMALARCMINFVGHVEGLRMRQPSSRHSKTMQRQQHQQKNAEETAHGKIPWMDAAIIRRSRLFNAVQAGLNHFLL